VETEATSGSPAGGEPTASAGWVTSAASATTLAAHRRAAPDARTAVTLVHGFAQTGRCLGPLASALADRYAVTAVDAPGHGGSVRHAHADLWAGASLLAGGTTSRVLVGYSMGGRLALHAALAHPERVEALVLIGATAGLEDPDDRRRRRANDEALAQRLERVGLDTFLDEWVSMPMFSGLPHWARFDRERRANTAEGLAASLRRAGTGSMTPLWDRLGAITCPVLLLSGGRDLAYTALASRLETCLGGPTRRVEIAGAGHAVHLEAPGPVTDEVVAVIERGA
jgi:2-succinyl-6-hydroxy-2,4-cyclohexadiene-1-carboxylate synthase